MADVRRHYVPADRHCLALGIGLAFGLAGLVWLATGQPGGFGLLTLGVVAAVGGMLLAGACARWKERERLAAGDRPMPPRAPAEAADDPMREMERDAGGGEASRPAAGAERQR